MTQITIVAFNYGKAGRYVNGPGMCLVNFVKKLRYAGIKVNVFSSMKTDEHCYDLNNYALLEESIQTSQLVHHWSGLTLPFIKALNIAKKYSKLVLIGPNVLDTVEFDLERKFLNQISFDKILTVNSRLKYRLSKLHQISLDKIELLLIGPDEELWKPISEDNGKILWKGNSKQLVKDVNFGLQIRNNLPEYDFEFIGYPNPYDYKSHINSAKKCHLYISTSMSETMGLALLEEYCAGIPSITHPKIYLDINNYQAGIITNRDIQSYCEAIREIMEDDSLYQSLSLGALNYIKKNFSNVARQYIEKYLID